MIRNCLKTLDSGFRRNDGKWYSFFNYIPSFFYCKHYANYFLYSNISVSLTMSNNAALTNSRLDGRELARGRPGGCWSNGLLARRWQAIGRS
jgi:hypothetical protein